MLNLPSKPPSPPGGRQFAYVPRTEPLKPVMPMPTAISTTPTINTSSSPEVILAPSLPTNVTNPLKLDPSIFADLPPPPPLPPSLETLPELPTMPLTTTSIPPIASSSSNHHLPRTPSQHRLLPNRFRKSSLTPSVPAIVVSAEAQSSSSSTASSSSSSDSSSDASSDEEEDYDIAQHHQPQIDKDDVLSALFSRPMRNDIDTEIHEISNLSALEQFTVRETKSGDGRLALNHRRFITPTSRSAAPSDDTTTPSKPPVKRPPRRAGSPPSSSRSRQPTTTAHRGLPIIFERSESVENPPEQEQQPSSPPPPQNILEEAEKETEVNAPPPEGVKEAERHPGAPGSLSTPLEVDKDRETTTPPQPSETHNSSDIGSTHTSSSEDTNNDDDNSSSHQADNNNTSMSRSAYTPPVPSSQQQSAPPSSVKSIIHRFNAPAVAAPMAPTPATSGKPQQPLGGKPLPLTPKPKLFNNPAVVMMQPPNQPPPPPPLLPPSSVQETAIDDVSDSNQSTPSGAFPLPPPPFSNAFALPGLTVKGSFPPLAPPQQPVSSGTVLKDSNSRTQRGQEITSDILKMDKTIDRLADNISSIDSTLDKLSGFNSNIYKHLELLSDDDDADAVDDVDLSSIMNKKVIPIQDMQVQTDPPLVELPPAPAPFVQPNPAPRQVVGKTSRAAESSTEDSSTESASTSGSSSYSSTESDEEEPPKKQGSKPTVKATPPTVVAPSSKPSAASAPQSQQQSRPAATAVISTPIIVPPSSTEKPSMSSRMQQMQDSSGRPKPAESLNSLFEANSKPTPSNQYSGANNALRMPLPGMAKPPSTFPLPPPEKVMEDHFDDPPSPVVNLPVPIPRNRTPGVEYSRSNSSSSASSSLSSSSSSSSKKKFPPPHSKPVMAYPPPPVPAVEEDMQMYSDDTASQISLQLPQRIPKKPGLVAGLFKKRQDNNNGSGVKKPTPKSGPNNTLPQQLQPNVPMAPAQSGSTSRRSGSVSEMKASQDDGERPTSSGGYDIPQGRRASDWDIKQANRKSLDAETAVYQPAPTNTMSKIKDLRSSNRGGGSAAPDDRVGQYRRKKVLASSKSYDALHQAKANAGLLHHRMDDSSPEHDSGSSLDTLSSGIVIPPTNNNNNIPHHSKLTVPGSSTLSSTFSGGMGRYGGSVASMNQLNYSQFSDMEIENRLRRYLESGQQERMRSMIRSLAQNDKGRLEQLIDQFDEQLCYILENKMAEMGIGDSMTEDSDSIFDRAASISDLRNHLMPGVFTFENPQGGNLLPPSAYNTMGQQSTKSILHPLSYGALGPGASAAGAMQHATMTNRSGILTSANSMATIVRTIYCPPESHEAPPPPMTVPPKPTPAQFCKSVVVQPESMERADSIAQQVSACDPTTFTELIRHLTQDCVNDVEKVRSMFRWITLYDTSHVDFEANAPTDSLIGMLRGIKYGQVTNNELFLRMCRFAGIHCVFISGYSKGAGYRPGMNLKDNRMFRNIWCAVYVAKAWRFVNCNWGARYLSTMANAGANRNTAGGGGGGTMMTAAGTLLSKARSMSTLPRNGTLNSAADLRYLNDAELRHRCDEFYFLTDPEQHIFEHFPDNKRWQLLRKCITMEQFMRLPIIKSPFFNVSMSFKKKYADTLLTKDGKVTVKINMPQFVGVSCTLENRADMTLLKGLTLVRVVDDLVIITAAPAQPGKYYLNVYIREDWQAEEMAPRELACSFQVNCSEHNYDRLVIGRYPAELDDGYLGRTPNAQKHGLVLGDSRNTPVDPYIVWQDKDTLKIPFVISPGLKVTHILRSYDRPGQQAVSCDSYALLQTKGGKSFYYIRFPIDAFYYLCVYASPLVVDELEEENNDTLAMDCVYRILVDCRKAQEGIPPFPRMTSRWFGCYLSEPTQQHLLLNKRYTFRVEAPLFNMLSVVINGGSQWIDLKPSKNGQQWVLKVNVGNELGSLSIYGRYHNRAAGGQQQQLDPNDPDQQSGDNDKFEKLLDYALVQRIP